MRSMVPGLARAGAEDVPRNTEGRVGVGEWR